MNYVLHIVKEKQSFSLIVDIYI